MASPSAGVYHFLALVNSWDMHDAGSFEFCSPSMWPTVWHTTVKVSSGGSPSLTAMAAPMRCPWLSACQEASPFTFSMFFGNMHAEAADQPGVWFTKHLPALASSL